MLLPQPALWSSSFRVSEVLSGCIDPQGTWLGGVFDRGSFREAMSDWAKSVIIGRARLGGIPVGVVAVETRVRSEPLCLFLPKRAAGERRRTGTQQQNFISMEGAHAHPASRRVRVDIAVSRLLKKTAPGCYPRSTLDNGRV